MKVPLRQDADARDRSGEGDAGGRGELPDFPFLAELPDRGPGADVVGRTAGLRRALEEEYHIGDHRLDPGAAARPDDNYS